jgi:hypothetical protein
MWRKRELDFTSHFVLVNDGESGVRVTIEPWAEQFDLLAHERLTIHMASPYEPNLEVHVAEGAIAVWGWAGSTFWTDDDARRRPRPPPTPEAT